MTGSVPPKRSAHAAVDLDALRRGDEGAFRVAVEHFSPRLLAAARAIVGDALAADVVQDAWITVYQRIAEFEERAAFGTWVTRIVVNRAISLQRRERTARGGDDAGADPTASWFDARGHWLPEQDIGIDEAPDRLLEATTLRECIEIHLRRMSDPQRQVVILRELEQWTFDAICNELELGASNARVLLHRGRMKLIEMISEYERTGTC